MGLQSRIVNNQQATAATGIAGAAGTVFAQKSISMARVMPGTLTARMVMGVKTSSLTLTPQWQVSDDNGSTWENFKTLNHAASVATAAGTGTIVNTTVHLEGPASLSSHRLVRIAAVGAGATAVNTDDFLTTSYSYVQA